MKQDKGISGMVIMELLVALAAISVLSLLGMRGMFTAIEFNLRAASRQMEASRLQAMRQQVETAWSNRCSHPFNRDSWLVIEGANSPEGLLLRSMVIHAVDASGETGQWRLIRTSTAWRVEWDEEGDPARKNRTGEIPYTGRILLDGVAGRWKGGDTPEHVRFSFPDAHFPDLREGFAIVAEW